MKKFSRWQAGLWLAGFALLAILFALRTPLRYLVTAPGAWPEIDPARITTVIVGNASLQGDAASEFVRLLYEDTAPHTDAFPRLIGGFSPIDLYSHGELVATFYYDSWENCISNSTHPMLLRRNVRTYGEAFERILFSGRNGRFVYVGRSYFSFPQLTPEEMHSAAFTCDGETVPIDAAQLTNLPELLDEIAKQSKPSEKAPVYSFVNKTKPDMQLRFWWGERLEIVLTQRSYEGNTLLVYVDPNSSYSYTIPLPAGYDLFAELGLAP